MPFVRAYFRETQELVFDAHDKAFVFYGGVCRRGIYDNMKTAVEAIFVGKARASTIGAFLQMCSHHLIEPVACTPASGWEKGQVREPGRQSARPAVPSQSRRVKKPGRAERVAGRSVHRLRQAKPTPGVQGADDLGGYSRRERASLMELRRAVRWLRREGGQGQHDLPDHGRSQSLQRRCTGPPARPGWSW